MKRERSYVRSTKNWLLPEGKCWRCSSFAVGLDLSRQQTRGSSYGGPQGPGLLRWSTLKEGGRQLNERPGLAPRRTSARRMSAPSVFAIPAATRHEIPLRTCCPCCSPSAPEGSPRPRECPGDAVGTSRRRERSSSACRFTLVRCLLDFAAHLAVDASGLQKKNGRDLHWLLVDMCSC